MNTQKVYIQKLRGYTIPVSNGFVQYANMCGHTHMQEKFLNSLLVKKTRIDTSAMQLLLLEIL